MQIEAFPLSTLAQIATGVSRSNISLSWRTCFSRRKQFSHSPRTIVFHFHSHRKKHRFGQRSTREALRLFLQWRKIGAVVVSEACLRLALFQIFNDERKALENETPSTLGAVIRGRVRISRFRDDLPPHMPKNKRFGYLVAVGIATNSNLFNPFRGRVRVPSINI